jgi:hypothetical protein
MSKLYRNNGSEISPCIIAKVRYILDLSKRQPINTKNCSNNYWNETVEKIAIKNKINNYQNYFR